MKCLLKYKWVKLPRTQLPTGKGIMGHWMRLAARAAFRKGNASYCGYHNPVTPGMWSGGVVGLKSILGVKGRQQALDVLEKLQSLGYLSYTLEKGTKKLSYEITDWVLKCSGAECTSGAVYATEGFGFLCLPRNITQRLLDRQYVFEEADAWLDLWCHTTVEDYGNAFSFLAPVIQYGKYGSVLTLDGLGQRWGWEKTKVWRFFRKYTDTFHLCRLPGAFGCLVFNINYAPEAALPDDADIMRILNEIRTNCRNTQISGSDNERLNRMVAWRSRRIMLTLQEPDNSEMSKSRIAVSDPITRAYFSHGRNCMSCRNCNYDCQGMYLGSHVEKSISLPTIRGPCYPLLSIITFMNGDFYYGKEEYFPL